MSSTTVKIQNEKQPPADNAICIIPARSGSKGLPDKNMLFLDNQPVIFHTIDAAIASGEFTLSNIIVSTDSPLYRDICLTRGIRVVMRPAELASDQATTYDVLAEILQEFPDEQVFVLLQPTSPLRTATQIKQALALYRHETEVDSVVSCVQVDKSPRLFSRLSTKGYLQDIVGVDRGYRRQDHDQLYVPNGAIYISAKKNYLQASSFFTERTKAFIMDQKTSLDIDSKTDFVYAIGSLYFDYKRREENQRHFFAEQYRRLSQQPTATGVIIGDSRMLAIQLKEYKNMAIGGVTLATALKNIDQIVSDHPQKAFVSIGVNDICTGERFETIQANFAKLFHRLQLQKCKIYCTTIAYALFRDAIDNQLILRLNDWLKDYCFERDILLLDINYLLAQEGRLRYEYTTDGLHFTKQANDMLQQAYEKFIQ